MNLLNIAIKDQSLLDEVLALLEPLKLKGLEIMQVEEITKEDLEDVKLIEKTLADNEEFFSMDDFQKL